MQAGATPFVAQPPASISDRTEQLPRLFLDLLSSVLGFWASIASHCPNRGCCIQYGHFWEAKAIIASNAPPNVPQTILDFKGGIIGQRFLVMLRKRVSDLCAAALSSASGALFTQHLNLRSCDEIEQLQRNGNLKKVTGLLFGGEGGDKVRQSVMPFLDQAAERDGGIMGILEGAGFKFPHRDAINMAKQLLQLADGCAQAPHGSRVGHGPWGRLWSPYVGRLHVVC